MTARATPDRRSAYGHFREITTRWMDNDAYRHINNVVYYSFFDTVVCQYLIEAQVLDVERSRSSDSSLRPGASISRPSHFRSV